MAKAKPRKSANVVTMPVTESPVAPVNRSERITDGDIATRAFEIYCARGSGHGHDVEDWLQAERELRTPETAVA